MPLNDDRTRTKRLEYLVSRVSSDLGGVAKALLSVSDLDSLSPDELAFIWESLFVEFEVGISSGRKARRWRRLIMRFAMSHVPALGKTEGGFLKSWQRKFKKWVSSGRSPGSFRDGRVAANRSRHKPDLPPEDVDAITAAEGLETVKAGQLMGRMTVLQVALQLSASRNTVYRYIKDGTIPHQFVQYAGPRRIRISSAAVPHVLAKFLRAREE